MTNAKITFDGIHLTLPNDSWRDISETLDAGSPFTLAKEDGIGALQFSPAVYHSGKDPKITLNDLVELVIEFGRQHQLGEPADLDSESIDAIILAAGSYRDRDNFVRAWYVSDGLNLVFITYVCSWKKRNLEILECEQIAQACRFAR